MTVNRRVVSEVTDDGVRRIRLESTSSSGILLNGKPVTRRARRYLDGQERVALLGSDDESETVMAWEAVPARTNNVLDFERLETATKAIVNDMAGYSPTNPPSGDQVASWLLALGNLRQWRKEAESRLAAADGQIDTVAIVLRQFVAGR